MLIKHSFNYLLARGMPGLLNFAALALYTRLLTPVEFGRYALLIAGVGFVNVLVFQWLRLVATRFLQAHAEQEQFLGGVLAQFFLLAALTSLFGLSLALFWPDPVWQRLLALAVPLLVSQAAIELSLQVAAARLEQTRYGLILGSKAVIAIVGGSWLAWLGLGAAAPVWGLMIGHLVALLVFGRAVWRGAYPSWPEPAERRRQLSYGLPLIATFALAWVVSGSDRLLLVWLMDEEAVGIYSAGYDLAFQSITLLLSIINTAAFPLAVKALEHGGVEQARDQLAHNGELIVFVALAGGASIAVLAPSILAIFVGEPFRPGAQNILPVVAVASALAGIKAYHFDIAFHLGERSRILVVISGFAAVTNVVLNLALIPLWGVVGAAWATLGAYALALLLSLASGGVAFSMPPAISLLARGGGAGLAAALGAAIPGILGADGSWALSLGLLSSLLTGLVAILALDLAGFRSSLFRRLAGTRYR